MHSTRTVIRFRLLAGALMAYTAWFALLSLDVMFRIWINRGSFQARGDANALLLFEASRSLTILAAVAVAAVLFRRPERPGSQTLALALLFLTVWYAKALAYRSYPGFLQEWLASALLAHHVPRRLLAFCFGSPEWALYLAAAGLLRFSVLFPAPLTAERVQAPAVGDRAGLLRSVPGAGLDVGAAFRTLAERLLRRGWLAPRPVWGLAAVLLLLDLISGGDLVGQIVGGAAVLLGAALATTNLRAGYGAATAGDQKRIRWLVRGVLWAGLLFVASALLGMLGAQAWRDWLGFALLAAAPVAFLACTGVAALGRNPPRSGGAEHVRSRS